MYKYPGLSSRANKVSPRSHHPQDTAVAQVTWPQNVPVTRFKKSIVTHAGTLSTNSTLARRKPTLS
jgi:hypothetical protein